MICGEIVDANRAWEMCTLQSCISVNYQTERLSTYMLYIVHVKFEFEAV